MKIKDIYEGISSKLYHFTDFLTVDKILKSDSIRSKAGAISFSRSIHGQYPSNYRLIGVIFEFDGELLRHNHKGAPVGDLEYDEEEGDLFPSGRGLRQFEDYIKTNEIKNVFKFIKSATVYVPQYTRDTDEFGESYRQQALDALEVIDKLKRKRIRIFYASSPRGLIRPSASPQAEAEVLSNLTDYI